ncbi:MAG: hypothetical protein KW806_02505 [Candidatus Yanofskybacteria bacterium]|nr:hypothetical protein [Candidatus Yanofskybacteria bacterium]
MKLKMLAVVGLALSLGFITACGQSSPNAPSAPVAGDPWTDSHVTNGMVSTKSVTFDNQTGTGFVGKGDVQTAFSWNNAQLQSHALSLLFSYNTTQTYAAICTWVTGEGTRGEQTHQIALIRRASVNAGVVYDPRIRNQVTGFKLTGYGTITTDGELPVVGESCVGNDTGIAHNGVWTSVEPICATAPDSCIIGGLYVDYAGNAGNSVLLR